MMNIYGDKGQAGNMQPERLNPESSIKEHAIVQTVIERHGGGNNKTSRHTSGHKSNRMIDAKIQFYGTYIQLGLIELSKSSLIDLEALRGDRAQA